MIEIEPNLGIMATCSMCGKRFWNEDGYFICSKSCDVILQQRIELEEELEAEELTREEKIKFCVDSVYEFEGVRVTEEIFSKLSDEELDDEVEWFDYLWTK